MDENEIMQQESQGGENDSFLDGWEETGPEQEVEPSGEGGENAQDGAQGGPGEGETPPPAGAGGSLPEEGQEAQGGEPGGDAPEDGKQGAVSQEAGEQGGEAPPAPVPKTWTVDHMGQAVTITEADVPILAQKALDYDRIRTSYDEARPVMDLFRDFARQAGVPVGEYVSRLRTQAKQAQGMDEEAARRAVELEDREARVAAQEEADRRQREAAAQAQARNAQRQSRIQSDVQEFMSVFPDAARDFRSIPQEVWDAVNGGMSLVAAYARYHSAQAEANAKSKAEEQRRQEAVQRQNEQNAAASTGSMKSAGTNHGPKDPFLEGWDE